MPQMGADEPWAQRQSFTGLQDLQDLQDNSENHENPVIL
jgi:hypothetical protein